jgi:hypothetical protein
MAEGPEVICAQMLQGCAKQALEKLEEKNTSQEDPSKWQRGDGLRADRGEGTSFCYLPCRDRR